MSLLTVPITVNGATLALLPEGAMFWPEERTLIVSDLHFEKGSAFAARGVMLPPYDTRSTLRRLAALMARLKPLRVISLGDAFHDEAAEARLDEADAAALESLVSAASWVWILGNHDPAPPARFAGVAVTETRIGPLLFRHEPKPGVAPGEIAGHLHPCAKVVTEGRRIRRPCFASDGARLVMPAFGAYAGGLNVLDPAFAPLFSDVTAWVLGRNGVYPVTAPRLAPDPRDAAPLRKRAG